MRRAVLDRLLLSWMAGSALLYVLLPDGAPVTRAVTDILPVIAASFAVSTAIFASQDLAFSKSLRKALYLFSLGIGLWALGEAAWFVYEIGLGVIEPYPSLADAFWIAGYPLLIWGSIDILRGFKGLLNWNTIFMSVTGTIVAFTLAAWAFFIPMGADPSIGAVEKALNIAYPTFDFLLLLATTVVLGTMFRGLYTRPWLFLAMGLAAFAMADLAFSYLTWKGMYEGVFLWKAVTDLTWIAGYLLTAKGLYEIRAVVTEKGA
jgi:hypothetical protein